MHIQREHEISLCSSNHRDLGTVTAQEPGPLGLLLEMECCFESNRKCGTGLGARQQGVRKRILHAGEAFGKTITCDNLEDR